LLDQTKKDEKSATAQYRLTLEKMTSYTEKENLFCCNETKYTLLYKRTPKMAVIMPATLTTVTGLRRATSDTVMTAMRLVQLATA